MTVATGNYEYMHIYTHSNTYPEPLRPFNFLKEILLKKGDAPLAQTKSSAEKKGVNMHPSPPHEL